jgi:hypothetical protein
MEVAMSLHAHTAAPAAWPWASCPPAPPPAEVAAGLELLNHSLHWPFDAMRSQHARAVQVGLLAKSMLASRDFEQAVDALEHITLGPFARSV